MIRLPVRPPALSAALLAALLAGLLLAGCVNPGDPAATARATLAEAAQSADDGESRSPLQAAVDELLPVSDANRPLRLCWLAAGVVEVETAKARLLEPARATAALGRAQALIRAAGQGALTGPLWREADMARVALVFGRALLDIGEGKVATYLRRGLSVETALFAARQAAVDAVVLPAVFRDIRRTLAEVEAGELDPAAAWAACAARIQDNQATLATLAGG